jgi:hypothetical protein
VVQPTTKPLHVGGKPSSSTLVLCSDTRSLKVEEDMEQTATIDWCTLGIQNLEVMFCCRPKRAIQVLAYCNGPKTCVLVLVVCNNRVVI